MININNDHLGRAARCAAGFYGARRCVANFQEAHQARRHAAARELLSRAAYIGKVRARTGAIFKQPCLARPKIHDAAFGEQIVISRLDETGMGLRMLIGAR